MQTNRSATYSDNHVILGCFEVSGRVYALDISNIREVVRWHPVTPLPGAPALIEGVIDLRGAVVPVVDLGRALGLCEVESGARARIAVCELDDLVMQVEVGRLEDPPALATQTGYDAARAVVRRVDAEPILVLSFEHLLEAVYRSGLGEREERE